MPISCSAQQTHFVAASNASLYRELLNVVVHDRWNADLRVLQSMVLCFLGFPREMEKKL